AIDTDEAAALKIARTTLGIRCAELLEGVHAGSLIRHRHSHDARAGGLHEAVPAWRHDEAGLLQRSHLELRHRLADLDRLRHEKSGDENVARLALDPKRGVEDSTVQFDECHGAMVSRRHA